MLYQLHELGRAWMAPMTYWAEASAKMFGANGGWLSSLPGAAQAAAGYELLYRIGKDYEKPEFGIHVDRHRRRRLPGGRARDAAQAVLPAAALQALRRRRRQPADLKDDPVVLVVAPLSGHHATLLRDTVRTLLRDHKVYITDWVDARMVPLAEGAFPLDDYVAYVRGIHPPHRREYGCT